MLLLLRNYFCFASFFFRLSLTTIKLVLLKDSTLLQDDQVFEHADVVFGHLIKLKNS